MNEFWKYSLILLMVEVVIFVLSASFGVLPLNFLLNQFNQIENKISNSLLGNFLAIYTNNLRVDLISSIPIIGPPFMAFVIFMTGQVVYAVALTSLTSVLPAGLAGALTALLLFLMPHGVIELLSYAMASSDSIRVVQLYRRGYDNGLILKYFFTFLLLSLFNLAVAAAFESFELSLARGNPIGAIQIYALWIIAAPYLIALYIVQKRLELRLLGERTGGSDHSPQGSGLQPS